MKYWTDPWNPIVGCSPISAGCDNCYAEKMAERLCRMGNMKYARAVYNGHWTGDLHLDRDALEAPLRKRKPRVFFNSMCDPFQKWVPELWLDEMFGITRRCKQHTFIICTKRAQRMFDYMSSVAEPEKFYNVYLGVTVENQQCADERLPHLDKLAAAGWNTWISYEPALSAIDWKQALTFDCGSIGNGQHQYAIAGFKGIVCGGESGPNARPAHPDWFRSCRDACADAGIRFAFKQWGKQQKGRLLDGVEHWQLPWENEK